MSWPHEAGKIVRIDHRGLLRNRDAEAPVTPLELFFDLVFVFAVTQLSQTLLADFTPLGGFRVFILLMAMWWLWIDTSWVTNWLDLEKTVVRLMLLALMFGSLILSTSIPQAFGEHGHLFAIAYVVCQVSRGLFMVWALRGASPGNERNFQRITCWAVLSGIFWITGAFVDGETRVVIWTIGITLDYLSALVGFWTPGLGRSTTADWDVDARHLAERCGLFVLIALGESIVAIGATFSEVDDRTRSVVVAFVVAFISSASLWWIYFGTGATRANRYLSRENDPGRIGRSVYTYIHPFIVAGIVVSAVGDELVLAHPSGHLTREFVLAQVFGPVLFLVGTGLFKGIVLPGGFPRSHIVGIVLLVLVIPLSTVGHLSPVVIAAATMLVVLGVGIREWIMLPDDGDDGDGDGVANALARHHGEVVPGRGGGGERARPRRARPD